MKEINPQRSHHSSLYQDIFITYAEQEVHSEYPSLLAFLTGSRGSDPSSGLQWMLVLTGARGWHCLWGFAIWESTGEEHKHERCFESTMSFPFHRDISCHPIVRSRAPFFPSQHTAELRQFLISNGRWKVPCVQIRTCYIYIWKGPCEQRQGLWHLVIAHSSFVIAKFFFSHTHTKNNKAAKWW